MEWQPIETAPKDKPILAWCEDECNDPACAYGGQGSTSLCLYHAHAEGMSNAGGGLVIVEWGGEWSEDVSGEGWGPYIHLDDWWFRVGSEFEEAANPTHWMPLPDPPK